MDRLLGSQAWFPFIFIRGLPWEEVLCATGSSSARVVTFFVFGVECLSVFCSYRLKVTICALSPSVIGCVWKGMGWEGKASIAKVDFHFQDSLVTWADPVPDMHWYALQNNQYKAFQLLACPCTEFAGCGFNCRGYFLGPVKLAFWTLYSFWAAVVVAVTPKIGALTVSRH